MDIKIRFVATVAGFNVPLTAYGHTDMGDACQILAILDSVSDCQGVKFLPEGLDEGVRDVAEHHIATEARRYVMEAWTSGEVSR